MTTEFNSEKAVRAEVTRLIVKTNPNFFCPLINGRCNKECTCIGLPSWRSNTSAYYSQIEPNKWFVNGWYCDNGMFDHPPECCQQ